MARAKLTDQCLWLAHIEEGNVKNALSSLHSGSVVALTVDGEHIDFQRMAKGKDGRLTHGFNPVGQNLQRWRARYNAGDHQTIEIDYAGNAHA